MSNPPAGASASENLMREESIRISISLLVPLINEMYVGIFDRHALFEKNVKRLTALGGGCHLYNRALLVEKYSAFGFEESDARFKVPLRYLDSVLDQFRDLDPSLFEIDPYREVLEELFSDCRSRNQVLTKHADALPLSEEDLRIHRFEYLGLFEERSLGHKKPEEMTHRILHYFKLVVPALVEKKIVSQSCLQVLSIQEIHAHLTHDHLPISDHLLDLWKML